ncbi:hypothetical protein [Mucilaginibacter sp. 21P]|nr:hypothetical protein [Mucilaginibacter sp. 21P]
MHSLTGPAQLLKPAVNQISTGYQVILGQEDNGVIGVGDTVENWN